MYRADFECEGTNTAQESLSIVLIKQAFHSIKDNTTVPVPNF